MQLGHPADLTMKAPNWPTVKVASSSLVIRHGCTGLTVRVKVWVPVPKSLVAPTANVYGLPVSEPTGGVPENVAVTGFHVSHHGRTIVGGRGVSDIAHVGGPVAVTVKVPAWPMVKVASSALLIWHAGSTVRVKI